MGRGVSATDGGQELVSPELGRVRWGRGRFSSEPGRSWAEESPSLIPDLPTPNILETVCIVAAGRPPTLPLVTPLQGTQSQCTPALLIQSATHFSKLFFCSRHIRFNHSFTGQSFVPLGVKNETFHLSDCSPLCSCLMCVFCGQGLAKLIFFTSLPAECVHHHTVQPWC